MFSVWSQLEKCLKIRICKALKIEATSTPEKERGTTPLEDMSLVLTPAREVSEEEPENQSNCGKIISDPNNLTPCEHCEKIMPYICHNTCACCLSGASTNNISGDKCGCSFKKHEYYDL
jgi:hypothetical protein